MIKYVFTELNKKAKRREEGKVFHVISVAYTLKPEK